MKLPPAVTCSIVLKRSVNGLIGHWIGSILHSAASSHRRFMNGRKKNEIKIYYNVMLWPWRRKQSLFIQASMYSTHKHESCVKHVGGEMSPRLASETKLTTLKYLPTRFIYLFWYICINYLSTIHFYKMFDIYTYIYYIKKLGHLCICPNFLA